VGKKEKNVEIQRMSTGDLPEGWVISTLGEISTKPQYGWTTKANHESGEVKLLRTTDITSGQIDWSTVPYCTKDPEDLEKYRLEPGDIVISRAGSVGVSYLLTHTDNAVFASYLIRFRPLKPLNKKYVYYYLKSPDYWKAIGKSTLGIAVPNVNATKLSKIKIPIAPVDEQKRIVAEIEKQFSLLDEAVDNLKHVKSNLKRYKASVLFSASSGKLTEDWRSENKTEVIPENMFDVVNSKRISNYNELCKHAKKNGKPKPKKPANIDTKFTVDEIVLSTMPTIPKEWRYVHIAFITDNAPDSIVDGPFGSSINVKKDYIEFGLPVIRINNIAPFRFISDNLKYLRKEKFGELKRHNILPGDILFGKVGTIGNSCIYPSNMQEGMLSTTGSCRIRVDKAFYHKEFLCLILNSFKPIFNRIASAGVQPFLNMKTIKSFPVPLLSLKEQIEIVKLVKALLSVAERIETQIDKGLRRAERLRQSILKMAFSGKLTQ
jgi:type I restriction enzyme S subunit